jgi:hypothetical protein
MGPTLEARSAEPNAAMKVKTTKMAMAVPSVQYGIGPFGEQAKLLGRLGGVPSMFDSSRVKVPLTT